MFEYLVTSRTRRRLLDLLWLQGQSGTVAALARKAGVAFAGAHRELRDMENANLAERVVGDGGLEYRANTGHPMANTLRSLLKQGTSSSDEATSEDRVRLREELAGLGAPVEVPKVSRPQRATEAILIDGCKLARRDASVARALPVVLARRDYNLPDLLERARQTGEKHSLGFFLELAGRLNNDDELVDAAEALKDRRRTRLQPFFPLKSDFERRLAESRTPEVARRWGWLMNMGMDSFEATFRKQAEANAAS